MEWTLSVTLQPPQAHPALRPARVERRVTPPRVMFTLARLQAAAPAAETELDGVLAKVGFAVQLALPAPSLPAPWHSLAAAYDSDTLTQVRALEAALALRLIDTPRRSPAAPQDAFQRLCALQDLPTLATEAVTFGLLNGCLELDLSHAVIADWKPAIHGSVHQRLDSVIPRDRGSAVLQGIGVLLQALDKLRTPVGGIADCKTLWSDCSATLPAPLACGLVFWAEATYCLSESGEHDDAQIALENQQACATALCTRLPVLLPVLDTGLWRHHLGRLAYYAGEFDKALDHFASEWRTTNSLDATRRLRFYRHVANVLTDIGELPAAAKLIEDCRDGQREIDDPELFKSLGRLGEIRLRSGEMAAATEAFEASLAAQAQPSDQTTVYLGHANLLAGATDTAARWYDEAERTAPSRDNPYLWMGRAALHLIHRERAQLQDLRELTADDCAALRGARVLPAAVLACSYAMADLPNTQELLINAVERLVQNRYLIEALYPLAIAYPTPSAADSCLEPIVQGLEKWSQAAARFTGIAGLPRATLASPTPARLLAVLAECRARDDWEPLSALRRQIYPFSLLEVARTGA